MLSALMALAGADISLFPRVGTPSSSMLIGSGLLFYVITAFSLMRIAKRTRFAGDAVLAWIPLLNVLLMLKIADRPTWWVILFFIPCVGFFAWVLTWLAISKKLGHGLGMGLLASFLPIVGLPLLALSD